MSEPIISVPLAKPPRGADRLSSKGNLLVAWRWDGYVVGENDTEYHFAVHSPTWGWRGYRWNEEYELRIILPATQNTMWARTNENHLMRLLIAQNGEATITNTGFEISSLLDANERGCLVETPRAKIIHLRFGRDDGQLSRIKIYDSPFCWAHFLPDGAIAAYDYYGRLVVLSPKGVTLHKESEPYYYDCPPFIIRYDGEHFYYTDDQRNGWRKSNALNVIRKQIGEDIRIRLFAILGDNCYIAVNARNTHFYLYRSSSGCPYHVECVWGIDSVGWQTRITLHSGLICITSALRIVGCCSTDIPENNGFLAWDPLTNTFYADIPRTTSIKKISTGQVPTINIPGIWGQDIRQR